MKEVLARAPGRINLIGEHTDYNDGFVMPCAIASETRVRATERADATVTAHSTNGRAVSFDLTALAPKQTQSWSGYLEGVAAGLVDAGVHVRGADVEVAGNVPIGAGLSSSASLEIAFALAMLAISDAGMPNAQLARLAQRAETDFVGTRCGIMDQFTVLEARAGSALFLDTRSLQRDYIGVPSDAAIAICNTMLKHKLAQSAYNRRRDECEAAVRILQKRDSGIRSLRDVSFDLLSAAERDLPQVLYKRARHVVTENERVRDAANALRRSDFHRMGALMYASHESLRTDYEVSCAELDLLVDLAKAFDGTIGARMTGGGFGGCTVNLVDASRVDAFREHVTQGYARATGIVPEIYDGTPSAGASALCE